MNTGCSSRGMLEISEELFFWAPCKYQEVYVTLYVDFKTRHTRKLENQKTRFFQPINRSRKKERKHAKSVRLKKNDTDQEKRRKEMENANNQLAPFF